MRPLKPLFTMHPFFDLLALLMVAMVFHAPVTAFGAQAAPKNGSKGIAWKITADRLTYFHDTGVIMGEGNVEVSRGDFNCRADRAFYDTKEERIRAQGGVVIRLKGDLLRGDKGDLDLKTLTGTIKGAHLHLRRNNINLVADQIWKTGPEEYKAKRAVLSTCPLPKQAWSFRCKDLELTVTGVAVARHSTFNIRKVPILYSPWVAVPINRYRKSGFLLPYFSTSSRNGAGVNVPFFWAISDSIDATFYQNPMTERGWMEGGELRYVFSNKSKGIFRYNFLVDTLEDDDYNGDGQVRGNEKRWWLRAKADQELPWGFEAKLDVDMISDRDYLQEFDQGPMGYSATNDLFEDWFGRSMTDDTDLIRPSTLQVTRLFKDFFLGGEGRYNDHQVPGEQDYTVQTAPKVVFQGFKTRIPSTPLFYDFKTSYVSYWREAGIREQRTHLEPRLWLPVSLGHYLDMALSAALEETFFTTSGSEPGLDPDNAANRLLYRLEADMSTTLSRLYHTENSVLRHTIRPRVTYTYRPPKNQDNLPDIDGLDRLEPANRVTYSLLSFLSMKRKIGMNRWSYMDVVRLKIEQSYDIREAIRDLPAGTPRRTFSEIYAEVDLRPATWAYFRYDTTLDVYGRGFTTYNFLARARHPKGHILEMDYRYDTDQEINELNLDLVLALTPAWQASYSLKRSFAKDTDMESEYGLRFQSSCWAITGRLTDDQDETRFTVNLELLGIGGWKKLN